VDVLNGLAEGRGKPADVRLLVDVANDMMGNTICAFADGTAMPMLGFVRKFREEFEDAAARGLAGTRLDRGVRDLLSGRAKSPAAPVQAAAGGGEA
jgi:NADH-quinone oxidoreductase subunit F